MATTYPTEVVDALGVLLPAQCRGDVAVLPDPVNPPLPPAPPLLFYICIYPSGVPSLSDFSHCRLGAAGEGELTDPSDSSVLGPQAPRRSPPQISCYLSQPQMPRKCCNLTYLDTLNWLLQM
jgi:hypothetical protein